MLEQFRVEMEIEDPIRPEAEGVWVMWMDADTPITISALEEGFAFQAEVCPLPKEADMEAFMIYCLTGNLFGQGTAGAILGIDEKGEKLILSREFEEPEYQVFHEGIEDFFNAIDFWRQETREAERR